MTPQQQWEVRIKEILHQYSNFGFQIEPGDKRLSKAEALQAINKAVSEIVVGLTEMPPYTTPIIARNDLRAEQRATIGMEEK